MCLLVLGVAGGIVLREGLREGTIKRATAPTRTQRARRPKRARPARHRPVRSGVLLVVSILAIGMLTGLGLGLVVAALVLALRSAVS
jgi:hypothetical protein